MDIVYFGIIICATSLWRLCVKLISKHFRIVIMDIAPDLKSQLPEIM